MTLRIEDGEGIERDLENELVIGKNGEEWMRFYFVESIGYGETREVDVMRTKLADFTAWITD